MTKVEKKYTRKIDREYHSILMKDHKVVNEDMQLDTGSVLDANDYLVKRYFDLSQADVDDMSPKGFEEKLKEVNESRNVKK